MFLRGLHTCLIFTVLMYMWNHCFQINVFALLYLILAHSFFISVPCCWIKEMGNDPFLINVTPLFLFLQLQPMLLPIFSLLKLLGLLSFTTCDT